MSKTKHLLFTFDYELFLGAESGTANDCLLRPTEMVMRILEAYEFRAIFFVDTLYLHRLNQVSSQHPAATADLRKINEQLIALLRNGHLVYPHVHPHWLDAKYISESNTWNLSDLSKYCFHALNEESRGTCFDVSMQIVRELQHEAGCSYAVDAYRAGGWSIQPFSDFAPNFQRYGIQYDFSVIPGAHLVSNVVNYDFRGITPDAVYKFGSDVNLQDADGSFTEIPISTMDPKQFRFYSSFLDKLLWRMNSGRSMGKGRSIDIHIRQSSAPGEMASIELLTAAKVNAYCNHLRSNDYLHFISHPKMLSRHNLKSLDQFLKIVRAEFTFEHDWKKTAQQFLLH